MESTTDSMTPATSELSATAPVRVQPVVSLRSIRRNRKRKFWVDFMEGDRLVERSKEPHTGEYLWEHWQGIVGAIALKYAFSDEVDCLKCNFVLREQAKTTSSPHDCRAYTLRTRQ